MSSAARGSVVACILAFVAGCDMEATLSSEDATEPGGAGIVKNRADGESCSADAECAHRWCKGGVCTTPRPNDGVKNGDESDVDCGGTITGAPRCALGKGCADDGDCASHACDYKKRCIARPSCKIHMGGDTCGPGEHDDPANQNESCCKSLDLPMPDGTIELDKYTITAGRMRVFLESIGGNVRAFVKKNPPPGWDPVWDDFVPTGWDVDPKEEAKGGLAGVHSSVWHQLGATALTDRVGHNGKPFLYGCFISGYGTHTYWMPDDVQKNVLQDIPHRFPKDILDTKALNCATSLMMRAFCHWDWPGSSLPTYLQYRFAYDGGDPDNHYYPWGNGPAPLGYRTLEQEVQVDANGNPKTFIPYGGEGRGTSFDFANWGQSYTFPKETSYPDMTPHIAAPGRYPKGNGPFGHADIGGNVFDFTSTMTGENGMHPDDREVAWGRNGTYGGHDLPFAEYDKPWVAVTMRKYGFAGGRCAKPKGK